MGSKLQKKIWKPVLIAPVSVAAEHTRCISWIKSNAFISDYFCLLSDNATRRNLHTKATLYKLYRKLIDRNKILLLQKRKKTWSSIQKAKNFVAQFKSWIKFVLVNALFIICNTSKLIFLLKPYCIKKLQHG